LCAGTREAHALYQYAQTADIMDVDIPIIDDSYSNVDCTLSVTSLIVTIHCLKKNCAFLANRLSI